MNKTINTTMLVALLLFLSAFFVANVNFLSGYYVRATMCAPGDIDFDGRIAEDHDYNRLKTYFTFHQYNSCADLNKDGLVNEADLTIFNSLKSEQDSSRQTRGRYCANECSLEGEKVCTKDDEKDAAGNIILRGEGNLYKVCGNFDPDPCLEWSPESYACPQSSRCRSKNPGTDMCILANLAEENILQSR